MSNRAQRQLALERRDALVYVAPRVLSEAVDCYPRCCLPASIAGAAALRRFGIDAKPVFVRGSVFSAADRSLTVNFGRADSFHAVIAAGRGTLIDLAAAQFSALVDTVMTAPAIVIEGRTARFADVIAVYEREQRPRDKHLLSENAATRALAGALYDAMQACLTVDLRPTNKQP